MNAMCVFCTRNGNNVIRGFNLEFIAISMLHHSLLCNIFFFQKFNCTLKLWFDSDGHWWIVFWMTLQNKATTWLIVEYWYINHKHTRNVTHSGKRGPRIRTIQKLFEIFLILLTIRQFFTNPLISSMFWFVVLTLLWFHLWTYHSKKKVAIDIPKSRINDVYQSKIVISFHIPTFIPISL